MESITIPTEFVKLAKNLKFKLRDQFVKFSKCEDRIAKLSNTESPLDILKRINPKVVQFVNQEQLRTALIQEATGLKAECDPVHLYTEYKTKTSNLLSALDSRGLIVDTPLKEVIEQFAADSIAAGKMKWIDLVATQLVKREKTLEHAKQKQKAQEIFVDDLDLDPSNETLFKAVSNLIDFKLKNEKKENKSSKKGNPKSSHKKGSSTKKLQHKKQFDSRQQHQQGNPNLPQNRKKWNKPPKKVESQQQQKRANYKKGNQPYPHYKGSRSQPQQNPRVRSNPNWFKSPARSSDLQMQQQQPKKKKFSPENDLNKSAKSKKVNSNSKPSTRLGSEGSC